MGRLGSPVGRLGSPIPSAIPLVVIGRVKAVEAWVVEEEGSPAVEDHSRVHSRSSRSSSSSSSSKGSGDGTGLGQGSGSLLERLLRNGRCKWDRLGQWEARPRRKSRRQWRHRRQH